MVDSCLLDSPIDVSRVLFALLAHQREFVLHCVKLHVELHALCELYAVLLSATFLPTG